MNDQPTAKGHRRPAPIKRSRPPVVTAHEIIRVRLLDRLTKPSSDCVAARLTLVRGPAGFGKTTLLAQAYRQVIARGETGVWLDCSEVEADAHHFLESLYAAADLTGIDKSEGEFTPADLAGRLARIDSAIYLFFDEFERLMGTPVEGVVERLAAALPRQAQIIIASRQAPRSWFLKRELCGLAATVESLDLRFTGDELRTLLNERFVVDDVDRIEHLTEGWPMAVQLVCLRSRDASALRSLLKSLEQGGHGIFEYLAERVVESLSAEQQDFLRDTSILPFVSPLAANAVMQRDDGYALLASVIHLQPIVTVTGDATLTIRLHPLFRQYMRDQLARSGQQREREHQRRAAEYFAHTGQTADAVRHALEAGDPALAVEVIDRAGGEQLIFTMGPRQVQSILPLIPATARDLSIRLRLAELILAAVDGRKAIAEALAIRFEAAVHASRAGSAVGPTTTCSSHWPHFALGMSSIVTGFLQDLHGGCRENAAARAVELEWYCRQHFATNECYLGIVIAFEILLLARHGRLEEARRCLEDYRQLCERNGFAPNLPSINPQRGLLAFLCGDFDSARRILERSADLRPDHFAEPELLMAQLSKALLAVILHERGRLEDALLLVDGLRTDPDATFPEILALSYRTRILCTEKVHGPAEADALLAEGFAQARLRDARRLVVYLQAIRLQLVHGRGADSTGVAEDLQAVDECFRSELDRSDPSWLILEQCARAAIPRLVALGRVAEAAELAQRLGDLARDQGRGHLEAVSLVLLALAQMNTDSGRALDSLRAALALTSETGAVHMYAELAPQLGVAMLAALGDAAAPGTADHVRSVLRNLDGTPAAESALWKTLSERERDIMLVLAAHASTKAIARTLGLAPETVKHHLKRIYGKLDVHTREQALARVARITA